MTELINDIVTAFASGNISEIFQAVAVILVIIAIVGFGALLVYSVFRDYSGWNKRR